MRGVSLVCSFIAVALPAPAQGWKQLDGKAAPEVSAAAWLNAGDQVPGNQALQGKVWLLEFFATW